MATVSEMKTVIREPKENKVYRDILIASNDYPILQTLYFEFFGAGSVPLTKVERTNKGEKLSPVLSSLHGEPISNLAKAQWDKFWSSITDTDILRLKPRE